MANFLVTVEQVITRVRYLVVLHSHHVEQYVYTKSNIAYKRVHTNIN